MSDTNVTGKSCLDLCFWHSRAYAECSNWCLLHSVAYPYAVSGTRW